MRKIKFKKTERGFKVAEFLDRYDVPCSIQKSSLASEDAIWFGCDNADPRILQHGVGWVSYDVPKEVLLNTRMHLTQKQVKQLLPILQKFAETGELE